MTFRQSHACLITASAVALTATFATDEWWIAVGLGACAGLLNAEFIKHRDKVQR